MKKITIMLALAALLSVGLTSCKKEKQTIARFTATTSSLLSKEGKALFDGVATKWEANDQIKVYDGNNYQGTYTVSGSSVGQETADFGLTEGDVTTNPFTAIYPASIAMTSTSVLLPRVQHAVVTSDGIRLQQMPMMAYSDDEVLYFRHLCGVLKLHLTTTTTHSNVAKIVLTTASTKHLNGTFTVSTPSGYDQSFAPAFTTTQTSNGTNHVTLELSQPVSISGSGADFYIYMPAADYVDGLSISIRTADGYASTATLGQGTSTVNTFPIAAGQYTDVRLNLSTFVEFVPEGAIKGKFTVNSNGKQVWFSQGNLQYNSTGSHAVADYANYANNPNGTWQFAPNQYEKLTETGVSNVWFDRFAWGTSGWNSGATTPNYYLPTYSVPQNQANDPENIGPGQHSLTGDYVQSDWGYYNAISNGGNQPGLWRTLTRSEWIYLLYTRDVVTRFLKVTKNTTSSSAEYLPEGMLIFPDNYTGSTPSYANSVTSGSNVSFSSFQTYSNAGAVFLPTVIYGAGTASGGSNAGYWTSTYYGTDQSYYLKLFPSNPGNNGTSWCGYIKRYNRVAVRLVQDVPNYNTSSK